MLGGAYIGLRRPSPLQGIHFLGAVLSVLPRLIDDGARDELCWVKLAHRKTIEPRLTLTCEAPKPRTSAVPLSDVDAVRTALAEEDDRHCTSLAARRTESKTATKDC